MKTIEHAPQTKPSVDAKAQSPIEEASGSLLHHLWAAIAATVILVIICCGVYPLLVWGIAQLAFPVQANGSLVKKDGTFTTNDQEAVGSALLGQNFSAPQYFHPRPSQNSYDAANSSGSNLGPISDKLLNGVTATQPATPPATQTAETQPATAAATQTASSQPAASTQPVETLAFDGVRLRVIHYAADNNIPFKFYYIQAHKNGDTISRSLVPTADLAKFQDKDGNFNDVALVDAFPHVPPVDDPQDKVYQYLIADSFATPIPADAVTASGSGLDPHISPENAALQAQRVADTRKLSREKVMQLVKEHTDGPSLGILGDAGVNVLMLNIALDKAAPMPASAPATGPGTATAPTATTK